MRNFSVRERAGLAAVVFALVVVTLGGWFYRQQIAPPLPPMIPVPAPNAGVDVPARGPATAATPALDTTRSDSAHTAGTAADPAAPPTTTPSVSITPSAA